MTLFIACLIIAGLGLNPLLYVSAVVVWILDIIMTKQQNKREF
jgi:hypothetical protein